MSALNRKKGRVLVILLSLAAIFLLAGLPQSPFSVIKNIKKKSAGQVELLLPSNNLSKHLSVDPCTEKSLESLYDSTENFNPAKSGLNVFKARLAKEYKNKNFNNLAIKVLAGNEDSSATSKTCLLPLKAGTESSLAVSLDNQPITEVALGKQSVFCSKGKAYLLDDGFYPVEAVLKSYAKQIKDKKAVLTLKKQLSELKAKKARLSKNKKTERLKLDKDIRRVSLSISYAQYFSKDAEYLASFYNSVCTQSALIITPNSNPVVPTSAPERTIAASPTAIKTATVAATPTAIKTATAVRTVAPTSTAVSNRITAPSLLSPAASNTFDTIYTLPAGSSSITISWNRVEYKPGYARYLVRAVDLSNNSSILSSVNPENYSSESITLSSLQAGRKYRFWLHSAKEQVDYSSGSHTYSEQVDFFFSVPGSNQVTPTATPTARVSATATSGTPNSDYRVGDKIQLIKATNVRSTAGLNGNLLGQQQIGSTGTIVSGPLSADNITWWNVKFNNGVDGYCGEDNYQKIIPECNNGQTEARTFWKSPTVPSGQKCESQSQTWTCNNGKWQRTTGTYENASCYEEGAPGRTLCVNKSSSSCFSSITACVNQAVPGDICEVQSGNYAERIKPTVSGEALRPIIIRAVSGANVTVDGLDLDAVYFIEVSGLKFQTLTRDSITWRFNTHYLAGTYINGDPWVKGPVTISAFDTMPQESVTYNISRPCTVVGKQVQVPSFNPGTYLPGLYDCNYVGEWKTATITSTFVPSNTGDYGGSMLNIDPKWCKEFYCSKYNANNQCIETKCKTEIYQGLYNKESPMLYDANLNIAKKLPYTIQVSDSQPIQGLVSTSNTIAPKPNFGHAAVLTVVKDIPAKGDFRPYYGGPVKDSNRNFNQIDWSIFKNLAAPASGTLPDYKELIARLKLLIIEKHGGGGAEPSTQYKSFSNAAMSYGREIANITSLATLYLQTNASRENKAKVLVYLLQYGIDIHGSLVNGMDWIPNGGHNQGRLLPFYLVDRCFKLGDSLLLQYVEKFHETMQHFYLGSLPEWSTGYDQQYLTWTQTGYRFTNGGRNVAAVLGLLFMEGNRSEIKKRFGNHSRFSAFVDYAIDVFYPIETGNPKVNIRNETANEGVSYSPNAIHPFTRDMWKAYAGNP